MKNMTTFGKRKYKKKVTKKNILDQRTRKEIYELIRNNAGLHFRSICRNLDRKMGVVQYHISVLEKHNLIRAVRDGRYKCFFANDADANGGLNGLDEKFRKLKETVITTLRRKTPQKLITHLAEEGRASHQKLSTVAEVSPQAITFHTKKLKKHGIITAEKQGRQKFYTLSERAGKIVHSLF